MNNPESLEKTIYRPTPNTYEIKGLDLNIDPNTQKLCETYNQSSGATRSVLYILLLISVISLIGVFNSNWKFNWSQDRIKYCMQEIFKNQKLLKKIKTDTAAILINNKIDSLKTREAALIRSDIDDNYTIKASFVGISIDINDLGAISGIAMIILLIVLRFTLTREKNNLKIALNSVSERYNEYADYKKFKEIANEQHNKMVISKEKEWDNLISDINFIRRRYHYNFLSMNDVFNLPFLDTSENKLQKTIMGTMINKYLFYFFLLVYSYIVFNDLCSVKQGLDVNWDHTFIAMCLSAFCYIFIFNICKRCVDQKKAVIRLFESFWKKAYLYDYADYDPKPLPFFYKILIPIGLFTVIFIISYITIHIPFFASN